MVKIFTLGFLSIYGLIASTLSNETTRWPNLGAICPTDSVINGRCECDNRTDTFHFAHTTEQTIKCFSGTSKDEHGKQLGGLYLLSKFMSLFNYITIVLYLQFFLLHQLLQVFLVHYI